MMKKTICRSNGLLVVLGVAATAAIPSITPAQSVLPGEFRVAPIVGPPQGVRGIAKIVAPRDRGAVAIKQLGRLYLLNDEVYLDGFKGIKLAVGQRYVAFAPGPLLPDVGQVAVPTGILIIEAARPGVLPEARIERIFGEVKDGQELIALDSLNLPATSAQNIKPVPVYIGARARVAWVQNDPVLPSLQHYVILNVGQKQGVRPGDQFTIMDETNKSTSSTPTAPVDVAVVKVVRVTPYGSSAIIIDHDQALVQEGMFARMSARIP